VVPRPDYEIDLRKGQAGRHQTHDGRIRRERWVCIGIISTLGSTMDVEAEQMIVLAISIGFRTEKIEKTSNLDTYSSVAQHQISISI
jgi:hypothetical protein